VKYGHVVFQIWTDRPTYMLNATLQYRTKHCLAFSVTNTRYVQIVDNVAQD